MWKKGSWLRSLDKQQQQKKKHVKGLNIVILSGKLYAISGLHLPNFETAEGK